MSLWAAVIRSRWPARPAVRGRNRLCAGRRLVANRPLHDSRLLPSLAARQGERDWTGALYSQVQSRVHVAISRRYFARLIGEARR